MTEHEQQMSDGTLDQNKNQPLEFSCAGDKKESSRKNALGGLHSGVTSALGQALNAWETVTEQVLNKKSPDEKQLEEVKRLLIELKSKINQFGD